MQFHLQILGSGGSFTATRVCSSYVINRHILVDCGPGTMVRLHQVGIQPIDITHVFISHMHMDHFLDVIPLLCEFSLYFSKYGHNSPLPSPKVYVPEGYRKDLESIIHHCHCPFDKVDFSPDIVEYSEESKILLLNKEKGNEFLNIINNMTFTFLRTVHNPKCYALRVNDYFGYSADTRNLPALSSFFQNVHFLLYEATFPDDQKNFAESLDHSVPSQAAHIASISKVKFLILTHLQDTLPSDFLRKAKEIFPTIVLAKDLDCFSNEF